VLFNLTLSLNILLPISLISPLHILDGGFGHPPFHSHPWFSLGPRRTLISLLFSPSHWTHGQCLICTGGCSSRFFPDRSSLMSFLRAPVSMFFFPFPRSLWAFVGWLGEALFLTPFSSLIRIPTFLSTFWAASGFVPREFHACQIYVLAIQLASAPLPVRKLQRLPACRPTSLFFFRVRIGEVPFFMPS